MFVSRSPRSFDHYQNCIVKCGFHKLRLLTECFIVVVGSVMFGATFNLHDYTCWITTIFGTPKNGGLKIKSLSSYHFFSHRNVLQIGVNALSNNGFKRTRVFIEKFIFCTFQTIRFGSNSPACSPHTYQIMYGETSDFQC